MDTLAGSTGIEELLAHEGWLRRVVAELVDDRHVEDVLQETWAAALTRGPARIVHPRAWLRRVARNQALRSRRSEERRTRRETAVARDDETPSTAAMVERLQAHQRVARAVAELDEPYRTVVLLRFFEDLPPRDIARRLGLPASTVRTRIERGLRQVRGQLEGADVRALALLILAPRLGEPVVPVATQWTGVAWLAMELAAMTVRHKSLTVVSVLLFSGLGAWLASMPFGTPPRPESGGAPISAAPADPEGAAATPQTREPVEVSAPAPVAVLPPLRGRVLDPTGRPLAGVPLAFLPATSDAEVIDSFGLRPPPEASRLVPLGDAGPDGAFELPCEHEFGELLASGDFVTVRTFTPRRDDRATESALVIAAPAARAHGRVVDPAGRGIAGATVFGRVDGLLSIDVPLDRASVIGLPRVLTDENGDFDLEGLPHLPELRLGFSKSGHETVERHDVIGSELYVTLPVADPGVYRVSGTVVDAAGLLVPRAMVLLNQTQAVTGDHGEFSVRTSALTDASVFGAASPGLQATARLDVVARLREQADRGELPHVDGVVIRLGPPALTIGGTVCDLEGKPISGAVIANVGALAVSMFHTVEDFVAGRASKLENPAPGLPAKIDARTSADGSFEVRGLSGRGYRLLVFDPDTLASATVEAQAGASGLDVRLDTKSRRSVRGTVRSRRGDVLVGVRVTWGLETFRTEGRLFSLFAPGGTARTDEHGGFSLVGVPEGDVELHVAGDDIIGEEVTLRGVLDGGAVDVRCWRRCRVRVEIADPAATRIQLLDADGGVLRIRRSMGRISTVGDGWDLDGGRTPVIEVSEQATTLVVLGDGRELARHAVAPVPGRVEVIRR